MNMSKNPSFLEFALKPIIKMMENANIKIDTNMKVKASFDKIDEHKFLLAFEIELVEKPEPEPEKKEEKKPDSEGN